MNFFRLFGSYNKLEVEDSNVSEEESVHFSHCSSPPLSVEVTNTLHLSPIKPNKSTTTSKQDDLEYTPSEERDLIDFSDCMTFEEEDNIHAFEVYQSVDDLQFATTKTMRTNTTTSGHLFGGLCGDLSSVFNFSNQHRQPSDASMIFATNHNSQQPLCQYSLSK